MKLRRTSLSTWFRALARANPTTFGRHTIARAAVAAKAIPSPGIHSVAEDIMINIKDGDYIDLSLYFDAYEYEVRAQFLRLVRSGNSVLDIGANIGFYTALAGRIVGSTGQVFAVEPNPLMIPRLEETIRLNHLQNVEVLPFAAGANAGTNSLYIPKERSHGHASLRRQDWEVANTFEVPAIPLDEYFDSVQTIDFVKADVEGAELGALRGAEAILKRSQPTVLVEIVPQFMASFGDSPADLVNYLLGISDYMVYKLDRHKATRLSKELVMGEGISIAGNYLFMSGRSQV